MPRAAQLIYPKDIGYILLAADIFHVASGVRYRLRGSFYSDDKS